MSEELVYCLLKDFPNWNDVDYSKRNIIGVYSYFPKHDSYLKNYTETMIANLAKPGNVITIVPKRIIETIQE